jgi:hypothetical protein
LSRHGSSRAYKSARHRRAKTLRFLSFESGTNLIAKPAAHLGILSPLAALPLFLSSFYFLLMQNNEKALICEMENYEASKGTENQACYGRSMGMAGKPEGSPPI